VHKAISKLTDMPTIYPYLCKVRSAEDIDRLTTYYGGF